MLNQQLFKHQIFIRYKRKGKPNCIFKHTKYDTAIVYYYLQSQVCCYVFNTNYKAECMRILDYIQTTMATIPVYENCTYRPAPGHL